MIVTRIYGVRGALPVSPVASGASQSSGWGEGVGDRDSGRVIAGRARGRTEPRWSIVVGVTRTAAASRTRPPY